MAKDVSVDDRTKQVLRTIIMKYRSELSESVKRRTGLEAGSMTTADVHDVTKYTGAGGETFVVNCLLPLFENENAILLQSGETSASSKEINPFSSNVLGSYSRVSCPVARSIIKKAC